MADMSANAFFGNKRSFCIVTGASRGLGWRLAEKAAQTIGDNSTLVVTARSQDKLIQLKQSLAKQRPAVNVVVHMLDMYTVTAAQYGKMIERALTETKSKSTDYEVAILFNNCATNDTQLNNKALVDQTSEVEIDKYYHGNLTSMICLTNNFVKAFNDATRKLIVQTSSIATTFPLITAGLYCAGKVARDMYMKCLAAENPHLRAISYAPGVLDTEMLRSTRDEAWHEGSRKVIEDAYAGTKNAAFKLTTVEESVDVLFDILRANKFENAAHIDVSQTELR